MRWVAAVDQASGSASRYSCGELGGQLRRLLIYAEHFWWKKRVGLRWVEQIAVKQVAYLERRAPVEVKGVHLRKVVRGCS